jgi:high-affinity iron transporter
MLAQAATLLIQADILPSQAALWDTSGWVREDSLLGQLLYAIAGYEATPTLLQASAYFGGIGLIAVAAYIARWSDKQTPHRDMP